MKIVREDKQKCCRPFPKLMIGKNTSIVVFMEVPGVGTVLDSGTSCTWRVGQHSTNWNISHFEDFEGILTLEND